MSRDAIKEQIRQVLVDLSKDEQRLLSDVLRVEAAHLDQKNPRVTDDILKLVKQVIT